MSAIRPPYTAAFYDYVRRELGYSSDEEYHILGGGIGRWDPQANNEFVNVSDSLRRAFTRNPFMKLYLGAGYYDMATPYFSAYYTLDHMGLPPAAKPNIRTHEYEAGHMYYINLKSLEDLSRDMKQFLDWAAPVK
jgi:carboxypeptidase C (cathepsin A)